MTAITMPLRFDINSAIKSAAIIYGSAICAAIFVSYFQAMTGIVIITRNGEPFPAVIHAVVQSPDEQKLVPAPVPSPEPVPSPHIEKFSEAEALVSHHIEAPPNLLVEPSDSNSTPVNLANQTNETKIKASDGNNVALDPVQYRALLSSASWLPSANVAVGSNAARGFSSTTKSGFHAETGSVDTGSPRLLYGSAANGAKVLISGNTAKVTLANGRTQTIPLVDLSSSTSQQGAGDGVAYSALGQGPSAVQTIPIPRKRVY